MKKLRTKMKRRFAMRPTTLRTDDPYVSALKQVGASREGAASHANLQRILVPLDFTPASRPALHYAAILAERFGSTIYLLHVIEEHPFAMGESALMLMKPDEEMTGDVVKQLNRLAREELPLSLSVQPQVRQGTPAREILNAAETLAADLIILAAHRRRSPLGRLLFGSTLAHVERHAHWPLLIIRCDDDCGLDTTFWREGRRDPTRFNETQPHKP
jgi:nucleotide-binding universal stress UspA family protein